MNPPKRLAIRHETIHRYARVPDGVAQIVRLTPRDGAGQRVLRWRVEDERGDVPLPFVDGFGNACHLFTRHAGDAIGGGSSRIVADGEVETGDRREVGAPEAGPLPPAFFLRATSLTAETPALRALAASVRADAGREDARGVARSESIRLAERICERIVHRTGVTGVSTSAGEALERGGGVCQDRSHVLIAAARCLGHPARYVSGYCHGAAVDDLGAMHAWAEVWIETEGWLALDPSSGRPASDDHVRVAIGLDYEGAAPLRGIRQGGAGEALSVSVSVAADGQAGDDDALDRPGMRLRQGAQIQQ